jgi:hypothetical protein
MKYQTFLIWKLNSNKMSLKVDLKIEKDEDWFTASFCLFFNADLICTFDIFEPQMFTKQDYLDFADRKRERLIFCDSNGGTIMAWTPNGNVICAVSKHGGGGDGAADCCFPKDLIVPKIKMLAERLE